MAQIDQGSVRTHAEVDRKTGQVTLRQLRTVYTDAIDVNGKTNEEFDAVVAQLSADQRNQYLDGYEMKAWSERP